MLSLIGWHDNFLKSHFDLYRALAGHAPHRLVVGPWEHTSYVSPFSTSRAGAVEFGPRAVSGVALSTPLLLDWFDRWIKGADTGAAGGVRYWQLGRGRVARGGVLAAARDAEQRWYLHSGGGGQQPARRRHRSRPTPATGDEPPTPTSTTRSTPLRRWAARR